VTTQRGNAPTLDEVIAVTVASLKAHVAQQVGGRVVRTWSSTSVAQGIARRELGGHSDFDSRTWEIQPLASEAAWELVRRGVLRPGAEKYPSVGANEFEFSLTIQGRKWLESAEDGDVLLLQPGALARTLAEYASLYGAGYLQRANEALKCRNAGAYLACCAMCGAAAESIILALGIAKTGDEAAVLKTYNSRSGRSSIVRTLTGQAVDPVRMRFVTYTEILSYWRDDASHGVESVLGDAHAEEALSRLLRLAQFAGNHWTDLTGRARS
jgi:hypothetical protein